MRLFPPLAVLAAAVAVGVSALPMASVDARAAVPGSVAAPAAAASAIVPAAVDSDGDGVTIDVVPESAGRLLPGADLTLTLTITNDSDTRVPGGAAEVYVGADQAGGRAELASWLDGSTDDDDLGSPVTRIATPTVVAGGSARLPPITLPAAALPFPADAGFGVHRVTARLSAGATSSTGTTALTLDPGTGTPTTRLALAMPLTVPTDAGGVISEELLEQYTAEGGLLSRQLDEAEGRFIAIGIDPRVIASIRVLGQTAPESALEWLDRLERLPNATFPLTYADTDIATTSQAGAGVLAPSAIRVDPARFPEEDAVDGLDIGADAEPGDDAEGLDGSPTPEPDPGEPAPAPLPTIDQLLEWDYTSTTIAWPRDGTVVTPDLDTFAAAGLPTTIVSSANAADPTGAAATAGGHELLVSDDILSAQLREAVFAPSFAAWQSAVARLTASLAVLSDGADAGGRVVLATLDRRTPAAGYQLSSTLAVLGGVPWNTQSSLLEALAEASAPTVVVDRPSGEARLAAVRGMIGIEGSLAQFATVADDPTRVTGERRLALLALSSQSWAGAGEDWTAAVEQFMQRSREILASVEVASTVLAQWSDNGDLPLVISNSLPYPVTVNVNVRASSAILDVQEPDVLLSVPGDSQKRALIPAASIANGEVRLVVTLTSVAGVGISAPASVAVTVNAGWETTATVVLAVLVVAVFVLGIVRTIRRRRRLARGEHGGGSDGEVGNRPGEADAAAPVTTGATAVAVRPTRAPSDPEADAAEPGGPRG